MSEYTEESKFERLYRLFDEAPTYLIRKTRFGDLMVYKRTRKQSWTHLGATKEQIKTLKKWEAK